MIMPAPRPLSVFIGDDFTGASDTLATWARSGARAKLFLDPAEAERASGDLDVIGIATELRGLPAERIRARMPDIAAPVARLKPRYVHYKVCSTFDSGPDTGSIGAAVSELERALDPELTLVLGGQPSLRRYCLFGNLFAGAADGQVYRIDRHPVMRRHPITPMTEADLAVHLAAQGLEGLVSVPFTGIAAGPDALHALLDQARQQDSRRLLLDAASAADIRVIGQALKRLSGYRPVLLIGASSVAEALGSSASGLMPGITAPAAGAPSGPCLVVAGSRSAVTEAQVDAATLFDKFPLLPGMLNEPERLEALVECVSTGLAEGRNVLAHTLPGTDYRMDASALTARLVDFVAAVLARAPCGRLGVAGGDTSSAICQKLGFSALEFASDLDPGVGLCIGHHSDPALDHMELMLKGGQMGRPDLLDRFARGSGK